MILRDTIDDDIDPIFAVRRHPAVLAQQFRLTPGDTPESWRDWLAGANLVDCSVFRCTTILDDDQVVGHITQRGAEINGKVTFSIGFNLLPSHWGRGLMREALSSVIPDLFANHAAKHVVIGYFRGNTRCERLSTSLGFEPLKVSAFQRAYIAYKMGCLRWIRFRFLDFERWSDNCR